MEVPDKSGLKNAPKAETKGEEDVSAERFQVVDRFNVEKIILESSNSYPELLQTENESSRRLLLKCESESTAQTLFKGQGKVSDHASFPEYISADSTSSSKTRNLEKRIKPANLTKNSPIDNVRNSSTSFKSTVESKVFGEEILETVQKKDETYANEDYGVVKLTDENKEKEKEHHKDASKKLEGNDRIAKNRLEKSQLNIGVLQQNLSTKINASTVENYQKELLESRTSLKLPVTINSNANEKFVGEQVFDEEFFQKHNLNEKLKIQENLPLEADLDYISNAEQVDEQFDETSLIKGNTKPRYSKKVSEVEKRWSGEFLENHLERQSSGSSKSSYVEEFGSGSSTDSVGEHQDPKLLSSFEQGKRKTELENNERSTKLLENRASEETLANSTGNTVDSDSCLEDRIKALEEYIETGKEEVDYRSNYEYRKFKVEQPSKFTFESAELCRGTTERLMHNYLSRTSSDAMPGCCRGVNARGKSIACKGRTGQTADGYANLIREFTMDAGTSRTKKEEKQKKKLGLRRLLPGFFSPKDSRKDYKKKESKEKKRPVDKHFARYQQNGNYTRSPDTMNLNDDIKRNVKLDNSLNGSIIEERLDEIKRELFSDQGPITSTPDHLLREDDHRSLLRHRAGPPRLYTADSSLSSIAPDERWNERNAHLGISPDIKKFEQRQKREEFGQRYSQLERKHSLQESNHASRSYFFQRNHGPSGRISAPPTERYLVRPRAIHPIDRPLPAIPRSRLELSNYANYLEEQEEWQDRTNGRYENNGYTVAKKSSEYANQIDLYGNITNAHGLILKSVSAQVKITRQPIVNQNQRAPLVGRSPKCLSSGSSQKSGDCEDSSCTPNSSQKSEFSPSSSKSGEYYLHSSRNSGSLNERDMDESGSRQEGIYENEKTPSRSSTRCMDERIYYETPPSPYDESCSPSNCEQRERSIENHQRQKNVPTSDRDRIEKSNDTQKHIDESSNGWTESISRGPSTPTGSPHKTVSPVGNRSLTPSRKAQPNEQIMIASPKREIPFETWVSRPPNAIRRYTAESPVNMTNVNYKHDTVNTMSLPNQDSKGKQEGIFDQGTMTHLSVEIPKSENIYDQECQGMDPEKSDERMENTQRSDCEDRIAWVAAQVSSSRLNTNRTSESENVPPAQDGSRSVDALIATQDRFPRRNQQSAVPLIPKEDQRYLQWQQQDSTSVAPQLLSEPIYIQRSSEPIHGQHTQVSSGLLSPSKQETRQHLEAFYWQQRALEAHRKSLASPVANTNLRQMGRKIDLPEVREAMYWQQLKKLNEEQQRRIYEQNLMEESTCSTGKVKNLPRTSTSKQESANLTSLATDLPVSSGQSSTLSLWNGNVHGPGANTTGKPPLMQNQKCQNQPVLIVRPQQAIRERREVMVPSKPTGEIIRQDAQRSRSASPHFHRGAPTLRKIEGNIFYEVESRDADGKAPPPIFKRGSLTVGESVDYGTAVGCAKRVSFSNHSTTSGRDFASGKWPTKHGIAAEPPTRKHCSEDCISDTDSMFLHQERLGPSSRCPYSEYDANKPLPPLPTDAVTANTTKPGDIKTNAHRRWNGKIDAEPSVSSQRILKQKEEEWNSDGKGRQSNDIGGSGRGEGEAGSNEVATGRRGGGGGIGSGGGSVLGVGGGGGNVSVGGVGSGGRSGTGSGGRSRDEPRRHTVGGNHQSSLHHQQFNAAQQLHPLHPHHLPPPPHSQYGTPPVRHTTMDLEMGTKSRQRKSPLPRGYPPPSSAMLFDDDPGIMSEVETSSTGFRRGGKQRSSLPVVRTPSKTLERPLGLVFLQYRNETKRALLPNEITSIDTVKALFVRSFPKQLTMEYLDSPQVKVYIHDSNKDMFYELEDLRSHLRDIRDRSVLRLFESADGVTGMPGPLGIPGGGTGLPPHWEDQSYFSEPEFDSEYQHQHIHKSKTAKNSTSGSSGYYIGGSSTLPRGGPLMRAYSPATSSVVGGPNATPTLSKPLTTPGGGGVPPAKPLRSYQFGKSPLGNLGGSARFSRDSSVSLYSIADRLHGESGYMSSPERGGGVGSATGRFPPGPYSAGSSYEDPYYSQYSGTVTPVIDEEASDTELLEESYSLYGVKPPGRPPSGPPRSPFPPGAPPPSGGQSYDATRIRVEHMERQLANLTGLVQKALTHAPHTSPSPRDYLQVPAGRDPYARVPGAGDEFDKHSSSSSASLPVSQPAVTDDSYLRTDVKPPKLGKDKSVSFEKSVSFSDEPPDMNSPKQHSPQHAADTKPTKPAIKSSTLPRMSSQERDRHKPTPPPKPAALVASQYVYRDLALTPEMYNQLRGLQRKAKDLRQEVRNLRRMSQAQAHTVRETILDTFVTIRAMLLSSGDAAWDAEKIRLSREEDLYRQEMLRLKKDLTELENTVEELRGNVINKKTRVNMSDVENMALVMSKSSKTVADLKVRFPSLQEGMKGLLSSEMEMVVRAEKFLKEEPEQLELALKRCKKLTSTLVTLKRLASVQEQRLPNTVASMEAEETPPITPTSAQHSKTAAPMPAERTVVGTTGIVGGGSQSHEPPVTTHQQRPENALDALLDELQTFSRPSSQLGHSQGSTVLSSDVNRSGNRGAVVGAPTCGITGRAPYISDIGRKGSVDSSSGPLLPVTGVGSTAVIATETNTGGTLRRLHSYPSSSDTDTSPPIARLQVSLPEQPTLPTLPQGFVPGQKPPVPERNAELLQLASVRRVPPPPPPRTSSRSPLASPTSPQLPPRNHACNLQSANSTTLRRPPPTRGVFPIKESGKPPMALPQETVTPLHEAGLCQIQRNNSTSSQSSTLLSTSNSSSCESVNSQEGLQNKKGRQEQLEQRHQELLRKQKALQEQYARLQQLQRNTAGLTTVPPAPPDLLKKTGSESNLLAKMGLGLSAASSGSLTSLAVEKTPPVSQESSVTVSRPQQEEASEQLQSTTVNVNAASTNSTNTDTNTTITITESNNVPATVVIASTAASVSTASTTTTTSTSTTSKIYETDIL